MQLSTIEDFEGIKLGSDIFAYRKTRSRRDKNKEPVIFILKKVKHKYVDLIHKSSPSWIDSFSPESGLTREDKLCGCVSQDGFAFFSSLASLEAYREQIQISERLERAFKVTSHPLERVPLEALKEVEGILSKYMDATV